MPGYQEGKDQIPPWEDPLPLSDTSNAGNPSTAATGGTIPSDSNPSGFTPMYIGDWHDPVGGGTTAPSDQGNTADTPSMTDQQMIDKLGFDPGDPRNDLTTGFGSGRPTQKAIGTIGSFLGNAAFPGLGLLTGAAASKITQMIQNGAGRQAVQNAIKQFQSGGGGGGGTGGGDTGGSGGGFKMPNFGNAFGGLPEGFTESNRFGGGAPTFTGPGYTGPTWEGGSIFGQTPGDRSGPLPGGSTSDLGGGSAGNLGYGANQVFSGIWDNKNPLSPGAYGGMQGFFNYNQTPFGGGSAGKFNQGANYAQYLAQWNAMRQAGSTGPGTDFVPAGTGTGTGALAGSGKPMLKTA